VKIKILLHIGGFCMKIREMLYKSGFCMKIREMLYKGRYLDENKVQCNIVPKGSI